MEGSITVPLEPKWEVFKQQMSEVMLAHVGQVKFHDVEQAWQELCEGLTTGAWQKSTAVLAKALKKAEGTAWTAAFAPPRPGGELGGV